MSISDQWHNGQKFYAKTSLIVWKQTDKKTDKQIQQQQTHKKASPKQQTQRAYSHLSYNLTFYVLLLKNACSLQIVSLKNVCIVRLIISPWTV